MRRERRSLVRVREERLRDLGGLMLEMFRRDQFRQDLLVERCDELVALDERLQELDTLLAATVSSRRPAPPARCACGAPLVWGSHFCANCGRPVAATPPVVACATAAIVLADAGAENKTIVATQGGSPHAPTTAAETATVTLPGVSTPTSTGPPVTPTQAPPATTTSRAPGALVSWPAGQSGF